MSSSTHNLHVPLSDELYASVKSAARETHRSMTEVAREAIHIWTVAYRKKQLEAELASYIEHAAGTSDDLDEDLEQATLSCLASSEAPTT